MSTDYTLSLPGRVDVEEAVAFFEGLPTHTSVADGESSPEFAEVRRSLVGDDREALVTFQINGQQNFLYLITRCLAYFAAHPWAAGYLAQNGEALILQRLPGGTLVLDEGWRTYADDKDDPALDAVEATCETARLVQVFL